MPNQNHANFEKIQTSIIWSSEHRITQSKDTFNTRSLTIEVKNEKIALTTFVMQEKYGDKY
jgi:hypothetical protein